MKFQNIATVLHDCEKHLSILYHNLKLSWIQHIWKYTGKDDTLQTQYI